MGARAADLKALVAEALDAGLGDWAMPKPAQE